MDKKILKNIEDEANNIVKNKTHVREYHEVIFLLRKINDGEASLEEWRHFKKLMELLKSSIDDYKSKLLSSDFLFSNQIS